jgi:phosphopantetheinyl transferase
MFIPQTETREFIRKPGIASILQDKQPEMPIVFRYGDTAEHFSGAVWHSTEPLEDLEASLQPDEEAKRQLAAFRSEHRRREWLTVRLLLRTLYPGQPVPVITYSDNGRPSLSDGSRLSISHSGTFVTLCWSPTRALGCDLEALRPQIRRLAGKFVNDEERDHLGATPSLEALHLIWGAKESLFKLYGLGGVDFRKDLHVHAFTPLEAGELTASMSKPDLNVQVRLQYRFFDGMLLVWTAYPPLTR